MKKLPYWFLSLLKKDKIIISYFYIAPVQLHSLVVHIVHSKGANALAVSSSLSWVRTAHFNNTCYSHSLYLLVLS